MPRNSRINCKNSNISSEIPERLRRKKNRGIISSEQFVDSDKLVLFRRNVIDKFGIINKVKVKLL